MENIIYHYWNNIEKKYGQGENIDEAIDNANVEDFKSFEHIT